MIVLHASEYLHHAHWNPATPAACLKFSDIKRAVGNPPDAELSYHLSKLVDNDLLMKIAYRDDKNRVYPLYKVSKKWLDFARETGLEQSLKVLIKDKYPKKFTEQE